MVLINERAFDVLVTLVERAGHLVTNDELLERVWSGRVVEESNVDVQISKLRKLLGRRAIENERHHGYRFTLPVDAIDARIGLSLDMYALKARMLESPNVMYVDLPDALTGVCPAVYRVWDKRADSNHRYTTDPAIRAQMVTNGWVVEGYGPNAVMMCAPSSFLLAVGQ